MRTIIVAVLLSGLLGACASSEDAEPTQWTSRSFYPNEYCWDIYLQPEDSTPQYWDIRRWCDYREQKGDSFL